MTSVIDGMSEAVFADECRRWDEAILQHFVFGVPPEEPVFLSVHEDVLNRLGREWGRCGDDFLALVYRRWVRMVKRHGKPARLEVVLDVQNKLRNAC